jgi:hypothetical protein
MEGAQAISSYHVYNNVALHDQRERIGPAEIGKDWLVRFHSATLRQHAETSPYAPAEAASLAGGSKIDDASAVPIIPSRDFNFYSS